MASSLLSDERRQAALEAQLSQIIHQTSSQRSREGQAAGGIYSRLEAQFRTQQAAKALQQGQQQARNM